MEKLLVIGMGSESDKKAFDELKLDGKSIDEYFHERGIKVYHHPVTDGLLVTSIHRTTDDAISYAHDMRDLRIKGNGVVALFYGGLAFAMPGVVAAEAANIPIIGVPADEKAYGNIYPIPDGTGVAVTKVKDIERGLRLASQILHLSEEHPLEYIVQGYCKSSDNFRELLKLTTAEPVGEYNNQYSGLTVCLSSDPDYLLDLDKKVELGVFGLEKGHSDEAREKLNGLKNSFLVGRPKNVALFAARVVASYDDNVSRALLKLRRNEAAENYTKHVQMEVGHFR